MSVRTTEEPARGRQAAKRRSLAKAAWRVFLERGLAGTTVRAIAAEAEVSIGALYTYYSGKDGVVGDLVLESLTALRHEVGASARGRAGLRDRLQAGIGSILSFYGAGARAAELLPVLVRGGRRRRRRRWRGIRLPRQRPPDLGAGAGRASLPRGRSGPGPSRGEGPGARQLCAGVGGVRGVRPLGLTWRSRRHYRCGVSGGDNTTLNRRREPDPTRWLGEGLAAQPTQGLGFQSGALEVRKKRRQLGPQRLHQGAVFAVGRQGAENEPEICSVGILGRRFSVPVNDCQAQLCKP